ncbi:hypothetical protein OFC56_32685, partial [Escherichia coli]|nr:hypothetical protein [Escherichia coli]
MDKQQLVDLLSSLFQRQSNWTIKDLRETTKQPMEYLKTVLNEICTYNKRGKNKNTYELKEEYKLDAQEGEKQSGPST